jgi:3-oxoadipate enol-lactonase
MPNFKMYEISSITSLNVVFAGTHGPTLIFLHFWGGSSPTFSSITGILSPKHRTIAVDFRGWGESTGPQTPDAYSIIELASDVETLIAQLQIDEFTLIGHSMGGKVAQLIAGRGIVKGLKGLILIAPAPPTPLVLPADMKAAQMSAYSTSESAEFVVRNVLSGSPIHGESVAMLVEDMLKGNAFARDAWPVYAMLEDISAEAREIKVPVLIVAGGLDKIEPMERLKSEVLGNIVHAGTKKELVVVEGSRHLLPVEAPLEVAQHIEQFVGEILD